MRSGLHLLCCRLALLRRHRLDALEADNICAVAFRIHSAGNREAACELLAPVGLLERWVTLSVPRIARPGREPDPVAVGLDQQRLGLVGAVGPIPVTQR